MSKFEKWLLRRFLRKQVKQGNRRLNLINIYVEIDSAIKQEFTEETFRGRRILAIECFTDGVVEDINHQYEG